MPKQITVRELTKRLRREGFRPSPSHTGGGSHKRWKHKDDPTCYADISFHNEGATIPIGTLKSIEKTTGVIF
ncbi:type II toxin-antitoxin system HicA family toxin [Paenibacillus maysiensis]|uniref:type II toxin-antitoxin system HicA family toxin n=1 Tax=Paenibacillus maysiensis TaxID=1155954 RepID=UPI0004708F00|nr:type II toxin-antitoxin system HicA family toxin [Paenibacillus maysiensis]